MSVLNGHLKALRRNRLVGADMQVEPVRPAARATAEPTASTSSADANHSSSSSDRNSSKGNENSMKSLIRRTGAIAAALALTVTVAACGSDDKSGAGRSDVVFAIGAPVLIDSTAPYATVPPALGYWDSEESGVNVEAQPTEGATAAMQLMLAGTADLSNGGTSSMYQAAVDNPDVRIVSLQAANMWKIDVLEGSDVTAISQLKGTKIGVQSLSSASYLFGRAAVAASGLDPDKDVEWLAIGVGSQAAQALDDDTVAAYATYTGPNAVVASILDKKLVDLPTPLDEIPGLTGIATTKDFLEGSRDTLVDFLAGYYQGLVFGAENPGAALQIHWQKYPEQKPEGAIEKAVAATVPTVQERYAYSAEPGPDGVIGEISMEDAQKGIDFMYEYGIIEKPLKAEDLVDLSPSIDAAAKYDIDAVKQQAADWTP